MEFMSTLFKTLLIVVAGMFLASSLAASPKFPAVEHLPSRPELPDPLTMLDGTPVKTPEDWHSKRRPELKALFQHYVYGYLPPAPGIDATVTQIDANVLDGRATLKEVEIRFKNLPEGSPRILLAIFLPNHVKGPVPTFLVINRCGNHSVIDYPGVTIDEDGWWASNCPEGRGGRADFYCVEYVISRGYAFATFSPGNYAPDNKEFRSGIFDYYPNESETRWGHIASWAWGFHRVVDFLVTDKSIDRDRIGILGHSRRGKTALLAAALDERIALVVPHQSGTAGCALSRNNDQETVERIARVFPHWFNLVFKEFGDNEEKLPIDQHLLIALVAPRPLLDTEGAQDAWANPDSALKAIRAADKVYKFLGAEGIVGSGLVQEGGDVAQAGNLVQLRLDTRHVLTQDYWEGILDFADKQFGR